MPVSSVASTSAGPPASRISSRADSMDRADFLQMLVAQLKSQDPLNPLDSQDFASQLATFSSLQELQGIGSTLDQSLKASLLLTQTFSSTMAAMLIGKFVTAESNRISVGATGDTELQFRLGAAASDITIEIRNSDGAIVRTLSVPAKNAGDHTVTWDGLNSNGRRVPAGDYTFTITARSAEGQSVTVTPLCQGRVSAVRYTENGAFLVVNGREIALGDVLSVSETLDPREGGSS